MLTTRYECEHLIIALTGKIIDFWGLQFDSYFNNDQKSLNNNIFKDIENEFVKFCKKFNLVGKFHHKDKIVYNDSSVFFLFIPLIKTV